MKRTLAMIAAVAGMATGAFADTIDLSSLHSVMNSPLLLDGDTILTGTLDGSAHICRISIADGATVTLSNVTITGSHAITSGGHTFTNNHAGITCRGDSTIILKGDNPISGFCRDYPGIEVWTNATLTIRGGDDDYLRVYSGSDDEGKGYGAGIGGVKGNNCGSIVIEGGDIQAEGGEAAAGIGGTSRASCGNIEIRGGNITAHGGKNAAGIGSGYHGTCGDITIGPGIELVKAISGDFHDTPIGAGKAGKCGTVTVDSSLYDRYRSYDHERMIRPWYYFDLGNLPLDENGEARILDGTIVTGTIATNAQLRIYNDATVVLRDVKINEGLVQDPEYDPEEWVEFGAGLACEGNATIILEGTNVVNAFHYEFPGIFIGSGYTLTIKGDGKLKAFSFADGWAAGIGGGSDANVSDCGNIVIESGVIEATGGTDAAGIGGAGENFPGCGLVVIGPNVTSIDATGGWAPIGSGRNGYCTAVVVDSSLGDTTSGSTRTITKGAGGGSGTVLPAPTFAADGDAATTKFVQGENGKWTLTAFAEMSNDALGKDVADGQIKVYAAPTVEDLDDPSSQLSNNGVRVKEKKSAVKTVIEVTPPGNPPSQFFRVKFGN